MSVPNLSALYQHQVFDSSTIVPIISVVGLKQFYFSIAPELKYNSMYLKGMITLLYGVHAGSTCTQLFSFRYNLIT